MNVFDHEDYLAMMNAQDESSLVLKAHLILEEFLNIWAAKVTDTQDLFAGPFIPFRTKLVICRNLGIPDELFNIFDKFNDLRNRFSHRRKYKIELSMIDSIRTKVDALPSLVSLRPCDEFEIQMEGLDATNMRRSISYKWDASDSKKKFLLVFIVFVLKLVGWMQVELKQRNIPFSIISSAIHS